MGSTGSYGSPKRRLRRPSLPTVIVHSSRAALCKGWLNYKPARSIIYPSENLLLSNLQLPLLEIVTLDNRVLEYTLLC